MVNFRDLFKNDGEINEELMNALTVLVAGLGIIVDGNSEKKKRSAEAARHIAAVHAKKVMGQIELDLQLFRKAEQNKLPPLPPLPHKKK